MYLAFSVKVRLDTDLDVTVGGPFSARGQYQARGESRLPGILPKLPLMPDNNDRVVAGKLYEWIRS